MTSSQSNFVVSAQTAWSVGKLRGGRSGSVGLISLKMSKTSKRGEIRKWDNDDLVAALRCMKAEGMSLRKASKAFGVPASTLHDKFHGKSPLFTQQGPNPYLKREEEKKIVDWAIKMANMGFRQTKKDIQNVVKILLEKDGREHPFANNTPGARWWTGFLKRNPNLQYRQIPPTNLGQTMVKDQRVELWFSEFEERLQKERALSMLFDPERLYDDDEESKSAIDAVLSSYTATSTPTTPGPSQAQSTPSASSTLPQEPVLTEPQSADVVHTLRDNGVYTPCKEYLAALPGMSQDQRKKKGLPPPAITVAEFFRYVRSRKFKENREQKKIDRRKMRESKLKEMEEEMNDESEEEAVGEAVEADKDNEERMEAADAVVMLSKEGESATEVSIATSTPVLEQERKKERVRKPKKTVAISQEVMQRNKAQVLEILNSVPSYDAEFVRMEWKMQKAKAKMVKQAKKKEMKKKIKQKQKKVGMKQENHENDADESQRDRIIEAKDKVRTKSNIMTITNNEEIYICPECSKSSRCEVD